MNRSQKFLLFCFTFLLFTGCVGVGEDVVDVAATPTLEETVTIPTAAPVETPTTSGLTLSAQPYTHPSGAYEIYFPQNWNCSETGQYRVDCQSPDQAAVISVRLIKTGDRLTQPDFLSLAQAEVNFIHAGQRGFNEVDRSIGDGTLLVQSTWMSGDTNLQGWDSFERADDVVYHLAFSVVQESWAVYEGLFEQVRKERSFFPDTLAADPIYASTLNFTSPDSLFMIEIPTSWTKYLDVARIPGAQIEQFFSPDRHASVQAVIYRHNGLIELEFKGTKTLEMLRNINGAGFRVSHHKALPDGRERLAWNVQAKGLSGISFFDSWGSSLYIFTVLWDDAYQPLYQPVLDKVVESFDTP